MALLAGCIYEISANRDIKGGPRLVELFKEVRTLLLCNHSFLFAFLFFCANHSDRKWQGVKAMFNFGFMLFNVYTLLKVSQLNYYAPEPMLASNNDTMNAVYWLRVVMKVLLAVIISNVQFLATRFFVKVKMFKDEWLTTRMISIQQDSLIAF